MVTNPSKDDEPTVETPAAVRARQAMEAARTVVAGSPTEDIRRTVLYLIAGLAIIGAGAGGWISYVAMGLGIVALLLLLSGDPA